jgi:hypothetical protein
MRALFDTFDAHHSSTHLLYPITTMRSLHVILAIVSSYLSVAILPREDATLDLDASAVEETWTF